jgi:3-oxoisoapionate kinase
MEGALPPSPLLAFYGDDFTGSTATLEAMAFAGLKSILFFETPDGEALAHAAGCQVIGIAGLARSKSPTWMDENLPDIFRCLKSSNATLVHYKICSTFDSAPQIGSIGKAIEIAASLFGNDWTPVLTALPQLGRWQAFGNLFAASGRSIHRIDRHPVMMRHPTTPMHEADLRLHLGKQTSWKVGLIDLNDLKSMGDASKVARETAEGARILLVDAVDDETMAAAGALLWNGREQRSFVVGSQGVEYALLAHWRKVGLVPEPPKLSLLEKVDRIAVVSGSCSPVTAQQIAVASEHGFEPIAIQTHRAVNMRGWQEEIAKVTSTALQAISNGRDPLVYSANGPDDPEVARFNEAIAATASDKEEVALRVGTGLGQILELVVRDAKLTRAVLAGGDSSGQACIAMGLTGVSALAPLAQGSPLCRATSQKAHLSGLEIALKGGQMGSPDFFIKAKG